jgi:hypothetical protein
MSDSHTEPFEHIITTATGIQNWGLKCDSNGVIYLNRHNRTTGVLESTALTISATGLVTQGEQSRNASTAAMAEGFAADTYVTGSNIRIPVGGMRVGQVYRWQIAVTKTAAGTAQAVYTVRVGTAGAIGDTARLAMTAAVAQTAAASSGIITVFAVVNGVAAASTGIIAGGVGVAASVGLGSGAAAVGSAFDNTALGSASAPNYVGLSINGGASAAWTISSVYAELVGP